MFWQINIEGQINPMKVWVFLIDALLISRTLLVHEKNIAK